MVRFDQSQAIQSADLAIHLQSKHGHFERILTNQVSGAVVLYQFDWNPNHNFSWSPFIPIEIGKIAQYDACVGIRIYLNWLLPALMIT